MAVKWRSWCIGDSQSLEMITFCHSCKAALSFYLQTFSSPEFSMSNPMAAQDAQLEQGNRTLPIYDSHRDTQSIDQDVVDENQPCPSIHDTKQGVTSSIMALKHAFSLDSGNSARPWRPAWRRFGPLSGFFTMLLAISSMIASLGMFILIYTSILE